MKDDRLFITVRHLNTFYNNLQITNLILIINTKVGCHPTRCKEFESVSSPDEYFNGLLSLIKENDKKVLAIGECGLGK